MLPRKEKHIHRKLKPASRQLLILVFTLMAGSILVFGVSQQGSNTQQFFYDRPLLLTAIDWFIPDDLAFSYGGSSINNNPITIDGAFSGGSATYTTSPDSQIDIEFYGNVITWNAYKDASNGISEVYVDGRFVEKVDLYSSTLIRNQVVFRSSLLPEGEHQLSIRSTGDKHESSKGFGLNVDSFHIEDNQAGKIVENDSKDVQYINANRYYYLQFFGRKLVHILLFFTVSLYVLLLLPQAFKIFRSYWLAGGVVLLLASLDEWHQVYINGRSPHLLDIAVDMMGWFLAMGTVYWSRMMWRKR